MNTKTTALLTAALLALSACSAATADNAPAADATPQPTALAAAPTAGDMAESIATALNSYDRADPPGGLTAPDTAQAALDGARSAYVQGDIFLYIDSSGQRHQPRLGRRDHAGTKRMRTDARGLTVGIRAGIRRCGRGADHARRRRRQRSGRGLGRRRSRPGLGRRRSGPGLGRRHAGPGLGRRRSGSGLDDPIGPSGDSAPANGRESQRAVRLDTRGA